MNANPLEPYALEKTPPSDGAETLARDYASAISHLTDLEAVESIQIARKLLSERLNEKVFSLQQESQQAANQAEFVSKLISKV